MRTGERIIFARGIIECADVVLKDGINVMLVLPDADAVAQFRQNIAEQIELFEEDDPLRRVRRHHNF